VRALTRDRGIVLGGFQTAALAWTLVLKTRMFDKSAIAGIGLDELRWHKPVLEEITG
jgi:acyl dehydratase